MDTHRKRLAELRLQLDSLDGPSGRGRSVSATSTAAASTTAKAPRPSQPAAGALVRSAGFGHR